MSLIKKPYLIIPKLIEQSTWGGDYILGLKNWHQKDFLTGKKIGQSYELFGDSKLSLTETDTNSSTFIPELGFADKPEILKEYFPLEEHKDYIPLSACVEQNPKQILGEKILHAHGKMPLLIKMNQAAGNSFQLHVKPGQEHPRWQPKPESWYFLEDGYITCGLKEGTSVDAYKKTCVEINEFMKSLSKNVQAGSISLEDAKTQAKEFIAQKNPWQFVNSYETKKYDLIDLSEGGVHHSWEEYKDKYPLGNIVYEVQVDVMDPFCTIRSFDQGKLKEDGSIREIHIDDFFEFMETDPEKNNIEHLRKQQQGTELLRTAYYAVDIFEITDHLEDTTHDSFCHLYVRDGAVEIVAKDGSVKMTQGHSCFIPACVGTYEIRAIEANSVVLKTFIS